MYSQHNRNQLRLQSDSCGTFWPFGPSIVHSGQHISGRPTGLAALNPECNQEETGWAQSRPKFMENRKISSTLPPTDTQFLWRSANAVVTIVTISCVRSWQVQIECLHNRSGKDAMLVTVSSRRPVEGRQTSLTHTHTRQTKHIFLFTYKYTVLKETISCLEDYRHILRTSQRLTLGISWI